MRVWLRGRIDQLQFRNAANLGGEIVGAAGRIGKPEVERVGLPDDRRQVLAEASAPLASVGRPCSFLVVITSRCRARRSTQLAMSRSASAKSSWWSLAPILFGLAVRRRCR
jgi:hypothetical protein